MSADRCEPAEADRTQDGIHYLCAKSDLPNPIAMLWAWQHRIDPDVLFPGVPGMTLRPEFWYPIGTGNSHRRELTPEQAFAEGWRYLYPVSPHDPAAVAALVKAAGEIDRFSLVISAAVSRDDPTNSAAVCKTILALRTATSAFPQPKDT